jgi:myo-inositol-1(or 4)-monophosphatase
MFTAEKGSGAYLNDKRLRVAGRKLVKNTVVAMGTPNLGHDVARHAQFHAELGAIMANTAGVRRFGSAALDLAWVAAGRYDAYWERGLKAWDVAAGILMVREAGGVVTDMDGGARMLDAGHVLVSNETLHPQFLKLLKEAGR